MFVFLFRIRTRAVLCHIYHHALHDRWVQARDLMMMTHLQENIGFADVPTQVGVVLLTCVCVKIVYSAKVMKCHLVIIASVSLWVETGRNMLQKLMEGSGQYLNVR